MLSSASSVQQNPGKSRRVIKKSVANFKLDQILKILRDFGVPYGNRTRVAAVKEKRFIGSQRKLAAWIAP
jgi:signal recognition particle subunit SEC65